MTTFSELVDECLSDLHGMTSDLEQVTFLTADISDTDTTLEVDDATQISRGLIEIGSELMWVSKVDQTANRVTIAPFGRGYRDSTAVAHTANSQITDNPRFPKVSVKQKINQAVSEIYPKIFTVAEDESNTSVPVLTTYPLPADCDVVIDVRWQTIGPTNLWAPVRVYKMNPTADTASFPTGKSIDIGDSMHPGRPIRITYIKAPSQFVNDTDTLDSIGLSESIRDVLILGAQYRLVAGLEVARLQTSTVEQSDRSQFVSGGAATAGSRWYLALFQERVEDEHQRLTQLLPTSTHLTR